MWFCSTNTYASSRRFPNAAPIMPTMAVFGGRGRVWWNVCVSGTLKDAVIAFAEIEKENMLTLLIRSNIHPPMLSFHRTHRQWIFRLRQFPQKSPVEHRLLMQRLLSCNP